MGAVLLACLLPLKFALDDDEDDTFFLCATLCRAPSAIDANIEADMTLISLITSSCSFLFGRFAFSLATTEEIKREREREKEESTYEEARVYLFLFPQRD